MKFSVATLVAFAAAVLAQPKLTNSEFDVVEGEPFTITWEGAEGPVTLTLKNGDSEDLQTVDVIASDVTGDSFTWTPEGLPSDTYAIEITDSSGEPNYSVQFEYEGTGTAPSASSSASSAVSSAASSAASSTITSASSSISSAESSVTSSASASSSESSSSLTTSTRSTTTRSGPTAQPTNNNEGQRFSSPLALLLVTVAAVVFFN